ncbi:hypothetical protein H4N49_37110, partial [Streptomyces sp. DHE17-7]|nr:hypothetical protein [Streptomyces sp. DHE17-7]
MALSIEVAMGAEILNATLSQVPDPEGKAFGSKIGKGPAKMRKGVVGRPVTRQNAAAATRLPPSSE